MNAAARPTQPMMRKAQMHAKSTNSAFCSRQREFSTVFKAASREAPSAFGASALAALIALSTPQPVNALDVSAAMEAPQARSSMLKSTAASSTVYFGNGCFWGRQKDFVDTEKRLGKAQVSAVVGYAAGTRTGPDGKVCYYYADPRTQYERLGHAEVVQLALSSPPTDTTAQEKEFKAFAETYFKQFKSTPFGMSRSDPQDRGSGYRNVVGLPGGANSPLFQILKDANVNGMALREGRGNQYVDGRPTEDDEFNTVWVVDSEALPFYQAERYHQFHDGLGKKFGDVYKVGLKKQAEAQGLIGSTGCPELPF